MDMSRLDELGRLLRADDPEETTEKEKDEIDEQVVQDLLEKHDDVPPISPLAVQTKIQLIETARWALAMDDVYDMSTRRVAAQRKVAGHCEPKNPGRGDGNRDEMTVQAVQKKVRRAFDGRYGRNSAQDLFDEVLEDIDDDYQLHMEKR